MSKLAALTIAQFTETINRSLRIPNIKFFIVGYTTCDKLINIPSGPSKIPNKKPLLTFRLAVEQILRFCSP